MFEQRSTDLEYMDRPDFSAKGVADTFRFLVPVNRLFGGIRPTIAFLESEAATWDPCRTYAILDVGSGAGDVAAALARWASKSGHSVLIRAIDSHPSSVAAARERVKTFANITVDEANALSVGGIYDYVHASQFLHHFADDQVPSVLRHLQSLCRRTVIVNDLLRSPVHYAAAWLLTLFSNEVFRHDARLSIRRGFRLAELGELLRSNGFSEYTLLEGFFYRFLLALRGTGE